MLKRSKNKSVQTRKPARKAVKASGAQRRAQKKSASDNLFLLGVSALLVWLKQYIAQASIALCLLAMSGLLVFKAFDFMQLMLSQPVETVDIHGELEYLSRDKITTLISRHVSEGYLKTDIQSLHQDLIQEPWLADVRLKRKMDNRLSIVLQERQVLAYWNDNALLDMSGRRFEPKVFPKQLNVPRLSGARVEKVLALYQTLSNTLSEDFSAISELEVKERSLDSRVIKVSLVSGQKIILDEKHLSDQIARLMLVVEKGMKKQFADVAQIDLRYSNGAAVVWKNIQVATH